MNVIISFLAQSFLIVSLFCDDSLIQNQKFVKSDYDWKLYCHDISTDLPIPPQFSKTEIASQFHKAEIGFLSRWELFMRQHEPFTQFQTGKSDALLGEEFQILQKTRFSTWFINPEEVIKESAPLYEVSHPLLFQDGARARNCIAFAYNNTVPFYNASTICLGSFSCIACEGPRSKDVGKFFQLLFSYKVTHLVRLTPSYDGEVKKCHPYWEGISEMLHDGSFRLHIPIGGDISYPIHMFVMEDWKDHQGINPSQLLKIALDVKRDLEKTGGQLAVHCSAGVGRTGTFLAALEIIDEIDRKSFFSIEEIVYRLSLQRFQCVAKASQYIVLHRLAEEYLRQSEEL